MLCTAKNVGNKPEKSTYSRTGQEELKYLALGRYMESMLELL